MKIVASIVSSILLLASCEPKGTNQRKLHPLMAQKGSLNSDEKKILSNSSEQEITLYSKSIRKVPGIPTTCKIDPEGRSTSCIICKPKDIEIKRCIDNVKMAPEKQCRYDSRSLKCIFPDQESAINISFKNSDEEQFINNLSIFIEHVETIINNKSIGTNFDLSLHFKVLNYLKRNSKQLILPAYSNQFLDDLLNIVGKSEIDEAFLETFTEKFNKGQKMLFIRREKGELNLKDGIEFTSMLMDLLVGGEEISTLLADVNIDGLIGENL